MALTATGMTVGAVPVNGPIDRLRDIGIGHGSSGHNGRPDGSYGIVRAMRCRFHDGFVTVCTHLGWVGKGWVFDNTLMRCLPVGIFRITAVALLAGNLAVFGLQKRGLYIYLFIQLQRSQGPASPLADSLAGLGFRGPGLFHLPR